VSAFREFVAMLGRLTGRQDPELVVWVDELQQWARPLAVEPGQALLPWNRAALAVVNPTTRECGGEVYGRSFRVRFPASGLRREGHAWALATWAPDTSGTGLAEARAVCRTCSVANGWTVGCAACATEFLGEAGS